MFSVEYKVVREKRIQKLFRVRKFLGLIVKQECVGQETLPVKEDPYFRSRFSKYVKAA
jgi:hypothetical protein